MKRALKVLRGVTLGIRERVAAIAGQSERTILLGTILLVSALSLATGFVLAQYYSVDALSSLIVFLPEDCYLDWPTKVGRHCFSDYSITVNIGMVPNPWEPYPLYLPPDFKPVHFNYTAAGMVPHIIFGILGSWLGAPRLGLFAYLLVVTIAVFSPAVWAARGARGLERIVVFVACGVAAIPAWVVIDRGNSVGFLAPIGLGYLVALCKRRWGVVTLMVVLAALVKPQFAVLAVALFVARQWRWSAMAAAGVVTGNLGAYALWPRDFPETIMQSLHNIVGYAGGGSGQALVLNSNVSFGKALLTVPDGIKLRQTGTLPGDFLSVPRSLIGYVVLALVIVCVVALGRRIPPIMAGIVLLATASLFAALTNPYYLVFVLPVAAVVVRDPAGPPGTGIFDRWVTVGGRRRAVGMCVSLATALCIAQIALPSPVSEVGDAKDYLGSTPKALVVSSTVSLAPILWLVACGVILVSYARQPAGRRRGNQRQAGEVAAEGPPGGTAGASELITEFSPQRPG